METVKMYIAAKTDRHGQCDAGYEFQNISDITRMVKEISNYLHENWLKREHKTFDRSVEEVLGE